MLLGSTPATYRYKIRPRGIKTQDFADFSGRHLHCNPGGILLNGRLLHHHWMDSHSVCGRLLDLTLATQRYKGHPCRMKVQDFADFSGGGLYSNPGGILLDCRLLHNCCRDSNSLCGRLLGFTPATQRYNGHPCGIKTQDFAVCCRGGLMYYAGGTLLDCKFLHNRWTDFNSVCGRLLGSTPATQRYRVRPCPMKAHEVTVLCGDTKLVELYSIADSSTAAGRISILFAGGCWA